MNQTTRIAIHTSVATESKASLSLIDKHMKGGEAGQSTHHVTQTRPNLRHSTSDKKLRQERFSKTCN